MLLGSLRLAGLPALRLPKVLRLELALLHLMGVIRDQIKLLLNYPPGLGCAGLVTNP